MSDLIIDGNKLMMNLADWWYSSFGQEETEEAIAIRKVMDRVEKSLENYKVDLPSAQPEQQWIPVSEGLPKKDGRYQVSRHDDVTNTEFIDILWYEKNTWWNRYSTGNYAVTAWMPLPEPYREGEQDENR